MKGKCWSSLTYNFILANLKSHRVAIIATFNFLYFSENKKNIIFDVLKMPFQSISYLFNTSNDELHPSIELNAIFIAFHFFLLFIYN